MGGGGVGPGSASICWRFFSEDSNALCKSENAPGGTSLVLAPGGGVEMSGGVTGAVGAAADEGFFAVPGPDGPNRAVVIGPCVLSAGAGACAGTGASCSACRHYRKIAYGG